SADANTQYSHEANSCHNWSLFFFSGTVCLRYPFYLNDGTSSSQSTLAWVCNASCNAGSSGSGGIADLDPIHNSPISVLYSLAEITTLLPPPFHLGTSQLTYVNPTMATFNNKLYVGWTGTDTHLNLMSSSDGVNFDDTFTISDTSIQGPSLAGFN